MKSHDHKHINKDHLADSAGVPWAGRAFEANPFADDDGSARPELIQAIETFQSSTDAAAVFAEFAKSRVLIPLVASLGESGEGAHGQTVDKSADLAVINVQTPDGQTGLPVFSSVAAMSKWNPIARPVPSDAVRVALAAASEGNTRIILDPGSETEFVFRRPAIESLAKQEQWLSPHLDEQLIVEFGKAAASEPQIAGLEVHSGDPQYRLNGPELIVRLHVLAGLNAHQLQELVERVTAAWATSEIIARYVDSMKLEIKQAS
jgi:hypothetical protein